MGFDLREREYSGADAYPGDPLWPWIQYFGLKLFVLRGRDLGYTWWTFGKEDARQLLELQTPKQENWSDERKLRHGRQLLSERSRPSKKRHPLFKNLSRLASRLGLSEVEQDIVLLAALCDTYSLLDSLLEDTIDWGLDRFASLLASVLDNDMAAIHRALLPNSVLRGSGLLLDVQRKGLALLPGLGAQLLQKHEEESDLFAPLFQTVAPSELGLDAFPHLEQHSALLTRLIQGAWRGKHPGVHIHLHGAPGTGKTEYARALASSLQASLVEVRSQNMQQEPIEGDDRFHAYALCQRILARQVRGLILFDEVEDVFYDWVPWAPRIGRHKGWTNRLLEEAQVPTIWISNNPEEIDSAYRRRMIYEIAFRLPPKRVRRQILRHHWESHALPADSLPEFVLEADLQPRDLRQLATALQLVQPTAEEQPRIITQMLRQRGHRVPTPSKIPFDLHLIECEQDLPKFLQELSDTEDARILLQGPPGTGKTAFARHLSERLHRDLHHKTASDLLSKYVGGTEQRLAEAFQTAEGNILFLDEADSFLSPRESAQYSWEVSMVNELLQQMERFTGILIMATNLRDRLDPAVFRRFDWELHFASLRVEKRAILLRRLAKAYGVALEERDAQRAAEELEGLVPADLAVFQRRHRQHGIDTVQELLQELKVLIAQRHSSTQRPVGFTAKATTICH
ncbi:MAG: AAA family ATPase [Acidithiobacillus sp.]